MKYNLGDDDCNFTKEQIDNIKKAVDHVDFLTGGSRNSKTKQIIEELQQENARLKDKIERSFKIVDDKLTNLNLEYGINNEFREEYDELWELLKEN